MHGRGGGEERKQARHMWTVPTRTTAVVSGDGGGSPSSSTVNYFCKVKFIVFICFYLIGINCRLFLVFVCFVWSCLPFFCQVVHSIGTEVAMNWVVGILLDWHGNVELGLIC
ncbi:hypothetical protein SLEP1_g25168 [Rubroshorea leprosula]|uniref:Transmembrane protein n=1 Tax=Rubroshorea leprosula TaxID=152421 RepID=A0AAV5JSH6_9ROSI|nr:hypothetical protein SLEP1_g25168 [Rubroshorea leprosula]